MWEKARHKLLSTVIWIQLLNIHYLNSLDVMIWLLSIMKAVYVYECKYKYVENYLTFSIWKSINSKLL